MPLPLFQPNLQPSLTHSLFPWNNIIAFPASQTNKATNLNLAPCYLLLHLVTSYRKLDPIVHRQNLYKNAARCRKIHRLMHCVRYLLRRERACPCGGRKEDKLKNIITDAATPRGKKHDDDVATTPCTARAWLYTHIRAATAKSFLVSTSVFKNSRQGFSFYTEN